MAKVFEMIVCGKVEAAIGSRLHPAQHGFRSGRSTTTNLVSLVKFLHNSLPESGQVDAIYLDLAKAFDRVDHNILLQKLRRIDISGMLVQWIGSYLRNRTQKEDYIGFPISYLGSL